MTFQPKKERRNFARKITAVNVEIVLASSTVPKRASTTDLSVGGCYIHTAYTFAIGTRLQMYIPIGNAKLLVRGIVKTCHQSLGNGIQFLQMAPADRVKLESFLEGESFMEIE
jgi:hypothetical protein